MMKTLKHISAALMLALAALASGCAADEEMTTATTTDGEDGELMTITVSMGSDATTRIAYDDSKVSATDNDALTWEAGDKLIVIGRNASFNYIGREEYTLVGGAGQKSGSFTGKAIAGATKYNIAYINTATQVNSSGGINYSLKTQIQAGDGNTNHLKDNLFLLTPTADVTDLSNVQLSMYGCTIMKFDLKNVPAEVGTLKKLIWTVEGTSGNRSMELAFSQKEEEKVTFSSSKRMLTAYLVFEPNKMKVKLSGTFTVTLEGDKTYYAETTVANGKTYEDGTRYTAKIDDTPNTMEWKEKIETVVQTTVPASGDYSYDGLKMQIGTWETGGSDTQILLGEATIADEKAAIPVDLSTYSGKPIWVCIPKVAKFFHTLTAQEAADMALTLPDKDKGSTLKAFTVGGKQCENDWIVALYMGVNKDGATGAGAIPIYWATGNLIATKTNDANSGATYAAFHIATPDETLAEATTASTYSAPTAIVSSDSDGYAACALGAQWNKFGWGDATGLKTSFSENYAPNITQSDESISGIAAYDIARAHLGGSWRLPTSDAMNTDNELAAFADNTFPSLSPDGEDWTESTTYIGRTYTYVATDANGITNTLRFPATGYRFIQSQSSDSQGKGYYWSGIFHGNGNGGGFKFSQGEAMRTSSMRSNGLPVRPVTE